MVDMETEFWNLRTILTDSIEVTSKRNARKFIIARDELDDFHDLITQYKKAIMTDDEKQKEKDFEEYIETMKDEKENW